jgi:FkbM family methyltransferase
VFGLVVVIALVDLMSSLPRKHLLVATQDSVAYTAIPLLSPAAEQVRALCIEELAANLPIDKEGKMRAHHYLAGTGKWNEKDRWRPMKNLVAPCHIWYVGANTHGRDGVKLQADYPCTIHVFEPVPQFVEQLRRNWKDVPRASIHDFGLGIVARTVHNVNVKGEGTFAMVDGHDDTSAGGGATVVIRSIADVWREHGMTRLDLLQ